MHVKGIEARHWLMATVAAVAVGAVATDATAGGFEVREQSTHFQGMSFAGAAAGGSSLSSIFWNPAASYMVGAGLTFESNYSLILPSSELTARSFGGAPANCAAFDCTADIGREAIVPASYAAIRLSPTTVFAVALNSQYGLETQPDDRDWIGSLYHRGAELFTVNVNPSLSYQIAPGITIGAGLQFQYFDLKRLQTTTGPGGTGFRTNLQGDNVDVGVTLGVNWNPSPYTSVGLGWRSGISHGLDGKFQFEGAPSQRIAADVDTPHKVTISAAQALSESLRFNGTVEWTQWSSLGTQPISPTTLVGPIALEFEWDDGWLFALGAEYDVNDKLTIRAGGAYEISPIQDPQQRLVQLPDADRIWASIGASYRWNESTTIDFAYSHVFVEDASFDRDTATGVGVRLTGDADSSVDIISIGLKSRWGGAPAAPTK